MAQRLKCTRGHPLLIQSSHFMDKREILLLILSEFLSSMDGYKVV